MKINENFLDLTTKQQKKPPFYPYKKKNNEGKIPFKKIPQSSKLVSKSQELI